MRNKVLRCRMGFIKYYSFHHRPNLSIIFRQIYTRIQHTTVSLGQSTPACLVRTSSNLPAYADPNYWDTRYKRSNVAFDWYADYSDLSPLLRKYIPKASRVLMVGCGNAVISGEMVKDGYQEVVNTDISKVVIEEMQEKYREMPELKYMTLDVRDMNAFENESFGSIIDKGLLDALLCGRDTKQNASKMMNEIHRVLKPGGTFVLVTHDGPLSRMPYLKAPHFKWSIKLHPIPRRDSRTIKLSIEPVDVEEYENLEKKISLEEAIDSNFVYACIKQNDSWEER